LQSKEINDRQEKATTRAETLVYCVCRNTWHNYSFANKTFTWQKWRVLYRSVNHLA